MENNTSEKNIKESGSCCGHNATCVCKNKKHLIKIILLLVLVGLIGSICFMMGRHSSNRSENRFKNEGYGSRTMMKKGYAGNQMRVSASSTIQALEATTTNK
ncbi:MAG: hypothetical protein KBD12_02780 [Candidatus Pacebacteria bacterium]|nr:hypothetical protein [Candidatus Paceibacterota bacterium]